MEKINTNSNERYIKIMEIIKIINTKFEVIEIIFKSSLSAQ